MATIRPRTEADVDACIQVLQNVHADNGYPVHGIEDPAAFLTTSSGGKIGQNWVAERDGRVIGHVSVKEAADADVAVTLWRQTHSADSIAVLGRLFLDPGERGNGVAAKLVETAVEWSGSRGERLVSFSLIKDVAAIRLCERLGWLEFGRSVFRWGRDQQMEVVCFAAP